MTDGNFKPDSFQSSINQPIRQMTDVGLSKLSEHLVETLIEKHYFSEN